MLNKIIKLGYSLLEAKELLKSSKNIEESYRLLLEGVPIQYLIGYVNFYGNTIKVNKNVLIPRYETELLVEKSIKYIKEMFNNPHIIDIGTGSGCIAISIKKEIKCNIDACDISKKALSLAKENSKENNTDINFYQSDILSKIDCKYDVIISNPPYISYEEKIMDQVKKYEPHKALFAKDNGLYYYKRILDESKEKLNRRFIIAFEIGYLQASSIKEYAHSIYSNACIIVEKDYANKDRYIFIKNE